MFKIGFGFSPTHRFRSFDQPVELPPPGDGTWILDTGSWSDAGEWKDTSLWKDS